MLDLIKVFNFPTSVWPISDFKFAKSDFSANLEVPTSVAFLNSSYVT